MKESMLGHSTRALLDAARGDGPRVAARAKMWGGVSAATGMVAIAEMGVAGSAVAASSAKSLVAGAFLGSAVTVGIVLAVIRVVSGPSLTGGGPDSLLELQGRGSEVVSREPRPVTELETSREEAQPVPLRFSTLGPVVGLAALEEAQAAPSSPPALESPGGRVSTRGASAGAAPVTSRDRGEDLLSRESALILEARGALRRGDAEASLELLAAAKRVGSNKLEPEELSIEARALRAVGRVDEASEAEARLRALYPDQALAR